MCNRHNKMSVTCRYCPLGVTWRLPHTRESVKMCCTNLLLTGN